LETAKLLDDLAEKVERRGMMLAYHDHAPDFRMVDGELEWLTIFNNTHRLRIQFDFGNALEGGQQGLPLIQRFPRRLISVHIKDFSTTNSQALLGEGQEDWRGLIPYLKGGQGPRWFIIEQETYPVSPLESAKRCLANFETMLKTY
jgi:sugar phosphate isomerase/epimerase